MFQKIKDYFIKNKEYIFSFLGKLVLILIVGYILYIALQVLNVQVIKLDPALDFILKIGGLYLLYKILKNQNDFMIKQNKLLEGYLKPSEKNGQKNGRKK